MKKSNADTSFLLPGFGEQRKNYNILLNVILCFFKKMYSSENHVVSYLDGQFSI